MTPTPEPRGLTVPHPPDEFYLEVTNRCNLKCTTCPQYWGMAEESADLTVERLHGFDGRTFAENRALF